MATMMECHSRGTVKDNINLSQRRAESVVSYLQENGATNRMTAKDFGEGDPVADRRRRVVSPIGPYRCISRLCPGLLIRRAALRYLMHCRNFIRDQSFTRRDKLFFIRGLAAAYTPSAITRNFLLMRSGYGGRWLSTVGDK